MKFLENLQGTSLIFAVLALFSVTQSAPVDTIGFINETESDILHYNNLFKRGCAFVTIGPDPPVSNCRFPTVAMLSQNLADSRLISGKTCLFYLGLGGQDGETQARAWYCAKRSNTGRQAVTWTNAKTRWASADLIDIVQNGGLPKDDQGRPLVPNPLFTALTQNVFAVHAALISQAMASLCTGEVYFFTPKNHDQSEPISNVWWAYELPTLTLNGAVDNITRVDPTLKDGDTYLDDGTLVWARGAGAINTPAAGTGYSFTWDPETVAQTGD